MFYRLGQFVHDHRWAVIVSWMLVAGTLRWAAPPWRSVAFDGDLDQLPAYTTFAQATRLNAEAFPDDRAKSQVVLVFGRPNAELTDADRQFTSRTARQVARLPEVVPLLADQMWTDTTEPFIGAMLKDEGGRARRYVLQLSTDFMAVQNVEVLAAVERVLDERRSEAPAGLEFGVTGSAAIGGDMLAAAAASLRNTDRVTILLVAAALAVIYRSLWVMIVPLVTIVLAAVTSLELLALLAQWSQLRPDDWFDVRVFTTTRTFIVVLLFGAGTNFCLFLIARFRELRAEGADQREGVATALSRVGGAISASALTTIVGLAMMGFADFRKFSSTGPTIAFSLAVALAVCLTLVPALLATWCGTRVVGRVGGGGQWAPWNSFWARAADVVVNRPTYVLELSLIVALPQALYVWFAPVTYDIFGELSTRSVSRVGTQIFMRHFPPGDVAPLTVLAQRPDGGLNTEQGEQQIDDLAKELFALPGVDKVRRLKSPIGKRPGELDMSLRGIADRVAANNPASKRNFVSHLPNGEGDVTRLFVVLSDAPFSVAAAKASGAIEQALKDLSADRDSPWRGARFEMLGLTAGLRDLERVTMADRRRIEILVTVAVFVVILALLRQPLTCVYLIGTVLASYLVTLGAVRLIFEAAYGGDYPGLDWKAPLFLFVILVAVGQDYNIFLVTRVFEEQRRLGPLAGLREAVIQTGGIISSCGVIMAVTFGSMMTNSLRGMVEMGAALSLGILIDTFIVRTIVVPAFFALLSRRGL